MSFPLKFLQRAGLALILLIVGVVVGLMAPLPVEAAPVLKIGATEATAISATLTLADPSNASRATLWPACWNSNGTRKDSGFTHCYVVEGISGANTTASSTKAFGLFTVGNVNAGNRFRVLVNDQTTVGSTDDMKATGFTLKPASSAASPGITTHIFLSNDFSNPAGTWKWQKGANMTLTPGGYPNSTESVQYDVLKLDVVALFPPTSTSTTCPSSIVANVAAKCSLGTALSVITYPVATNTEATNLPKKDPTPFSRSCTTQGTTCAVKVKYDYTITIIGLDQARADDSVSGCGGTCDEGLGTNKLAPCAQMVPICEDKMEQNRNADIAAGQLTGAVIAQSCSGTCITIILDVTPINEAVGKDFVLQATLQGAPPENFTLTIDKDGNAAQAFSPLPEDLNVLAGEWTFDVTGFPTSKTGTWQADQWSCLSQLNNGTLTYTIDTQPNGVKGPLHVLTLADTDIAVCTVHIHRDTTKKK